MSGGHVTQTQKKKKRNQFFNLRLMVEFMIECEEAVFRGCDVAFKLLHS